MPTLIDTFLIEVKLDAKGVDQGKNQVNDALGKVKSTATDTGAWMEAAGKKASNYFASIKNEALSLVAVLAGLKGSSAIGDFIINAAKSITQFGNALMYTKAHAEDINALGHAITEVGGKYEEATEFINRFTKAQADALIKPGSNPEFVTAVGVIGNHELSQNKVNVDPNDPMSVIRGFAARVENHKGNVEELRNDRYLGGQAMLSPSMIDWIVRKGSLAAVDSDLAKQKQLDPSFNQGLVDKMALLNEKLANLTTATDGLKNAMLDKYSPQLQALVENLTGLILDPGKQIAKNASDLPKIDVAGPLAAAIPGGITTWLLAKMFPQEAGWLGKAIIEALPGWLKSSFGIFDDAKPRTEDEQKALDAQPEGWPWAGIRRIINRVTGHNTQPGGSSSGQGGGDTASLSLTPEVRAFAAAISEAEGAGYNTRYGNGTFDTNGPHPGNLKPGDRGYDPSTAHSPAGRYQIIKKTWDEQRKILGLPDVMSPENQDKVFAHLLAEKGVTQEMLADPKRRQEVLNRLGPKLWASLPGADQSRRSMDQWNKMLDRYNESEKKRSEAAAQAEEEAKKRTGTGGLSDEELKRIEDGHKADPYKKGFGPLGPYPGAPTVKESLNGYHDKFASSFRTANVNNGHTFNVGDVTVHSQATDAHGVARDFHTALANEANLLQIQGNQGLV